MSSIGFCVFVNMHQFFNEFVIIACNEQQEGKKMKKFLIIMKMKCLKFICINSCDFCFENLILYEVCLSNGNKSNFWLILMSVLSLETSLKLLK